MRNVALEVPLCFFAVVGRGQGGHAAHAGVQALCDAFDHTAFACGVAAFKQDDHAVAGFDHPVLQHHQFGLQAQEFTEITDALTRLGTVGCGFHVPAVVEFQFEFFVHAVQQVFAKLAHLGFIDGVGLCHVVSESLKIQLSLFFVNF